MTAVAGAGPGITSGVNPRRQLAAGAFGHLVEWFDWAVYTYLAIFFSDAFFPKTEGGSQLLPLIGTFGVFAVGFLARPLGGMILGPFGDRHGRRAALSLSIGLMGGGSLIIAILPTYGQIGILAPILLTAARILQGISAGGEWGAAATFISESAPEGRRGLYSSFLYIGSNAGKILLTTAAAGLVALIGGEAMEQYGWRLMFLAGAALAVFGWLLRRSAEETADGTVARTSPNRVGMFDFFQEHPRATIRIFAMTIGPAVVTYTWVAYLPTLAVTSGGLSKADSLRAATLTLVLFLVAQPIAGALSDALGRKPLLIVSTAVFVVGAPFLLLAIDGTFLNLLIVQGVGLVVLSGATAASAAVMAEQFPARLRVSGIALPYSLAAAVFGGTAPLLATAAQAAGQLVGYGVYISLTSLITLATVLTLRESAHRPLP